MKIFNNDRFDWVVMFALVAVVIVMARYFPVSTGQPYKEPLMDWNASHKPSKGEPGDNPNLKQEVIGNAWQPRDRK